MAGLGSDSEGRISNSSLNVLKHGNLDLGKGSLKLEFLHQVFAVPNYNFFDTFFVEVDYCSLQ